MINFPIQFQNVMRSIFLCISISLIANTFISANQQDSLLQLLDQTEEPISKIDYYLGLARLNMLSTGDHHLALEYARKAYQEAEDISSLKYQAISQNFIGMLYYNLSLPYEEALQKAESLAEKSGDPDAIAFTKYAIIEVSEYDFEKGIKELEDVILKHGHQINQRNLGNVYKVLSWQYEQNGDLEEAEAANLNAIEILSEHAADLPIDPDLKRVSSLNYDGGLENLFQVHVYNGDLYVKMGRINDAIEMGKKAETIANQLYNKPGFAYLYTKQGRYYREAGEYEKAIQKFKQSIEIHKDLNEPTYEAGSLSELTGLYITLKEWDLAENSIKRTIQLTKEVPGPIQSIKKMVNVTK